MINLNKVILIGNITREIELKALPSGMKVSSFGIATNRTWKDNNGKKQEQAEFHNLIAFGKQAETIQQYCKKGDQLYIEGRLQTRTWEDKTSGEKKYKTEIILESFQFGNKNEKVASPVLEKVEEEDHTAIDPDTGIDLNDREDIGF